MKKKIEMLVSILGTTFFLSFFSTASAQNGDFIEAKDYCSTRVGDDSRCCDGRIDDCAVPIFGTWCYCDQFCNRTVNPDCCPDYWNVCLNITGPQTDGRCNYNGGKIDHGTTVRDNCNKCKCFKSKLTCENDACMVDKEVLDYVNGRKTSLGWSATNYTFMWGKKLKEGLLMMTGTLPPNKRSLRMYPIKLNYDSDMIPSTFDANLYWPYLSGIRDQGWCGSSWAFSTASVAQDRLIIASKGHENLDWSTQNLVSCNIRGQQGCNGGHVERAWAYLRRNGVVNEECYPYVSGQDSTAARCKVKKHDTLQSIDCPRKQFPAGRTEFYSTEPAYRIASNEEDIMWELMTNGPIQALMRVHQDFFMYRQGIYKQTSMNTNTNSKFSTHSVKLMGWGEEINYYGDSVKYWLAANSWGTEWGEDGRFKIRRGTNESDIEQFILAVRSRLSEEAILIKKRRRNRTHRNSRTQRKRRI